MLKQILQTLWLGCIALLLVTEMTWGDPLSSDIFLANQILANQILANHLPDPEIVVPVEPAKPSVQSDSAQPAREPAEQTNAEPSASLQQKQAEARKNASEPYDPYDYDAIREMNRQIYGEVKDQHS